MFMRTTFKSMAADLIDFFQHRIIRGRKRKPFFEWIGYKVDLQDKIFYRLRQIKAQFKKTSRAIPKGTILPFFFCIGEYA